MDKQLAEKMAADLVGQTVGGWTVKSYINHGKSAVVFVAERSGTAAALKIFDPEIVERYGRDVQLTRIGRERTLIGKSHPNLVAIYDGGEDGDFLFVAMEYFQGSNLADSLPALPTAETRSIISQIASAAKFLEDSSFAHRDIKPSNVGVSSDGKLAKLLDFGVLRPLDLSNVTDQGDQHHFIGTLQYSPPELLFREEQSSLEGWRAITFYQLGAVLHDLLMKKPLFEDFTNPYGRLVRAVEREVPRVDALDGDADLRLLAQNCLAKVPKQRLDTVSWEDFSRPQIADPMDAARRKIAQHRVASRQAVGETGEPEDRIGSQCFALRTAIHSAVVGTIKAEALPRYSLQHIREPNPYLLRALFEPSANDGLDHYFSCYCQGKVIDADANLQELEVWACVSPARERIPAEPDPGVLHFVVKGTFIEQDIRTYVQQRLLLAYAAALDSVVGSEPVTWLKVESAI